MKWKIKPDDEVVSVKRSTLGKVVMERLYEEVDTLCETWLMYRVSLAKTQWRALQVGRLGSVKSLGFEISGLIGGTERRPEQLGHGEQVLWSYGRGWDCWGREESNPGGPLVVVRSSGFILIAARSQWRGPQGPQPHCWGCWMDWHRKALSSMPDSEVFNIFLFHLYIYILLLYLYCKLLKCLDYISYYCIPYTVWHTVT